MEVSSVDYFAGIALGTFLQESMKNPARSPSIKSLTMASWIVGRTMARAKGRITETTPGVDDLVLSELYK